MKYCSNCGQLLTGDAPTYGPKPCSNCAHVQRQHPKILVACFIRHGDRLLWMRRALEPQRGYWAIPAGFLEQGENLKQGAARELWEETGIRIDPERLELYMMGTISFISEVYIAFQAEVDSTEYVAGSEALEVGFFNHEELEWEQVAYPQANNSIEQAYKDIERCYFPVYHAEMTSDINSLDKVSYSAK